MRRLLLLLFAIMQIGAAPAPALGRAPAPAPGAPPVEEPVQVSLMAVIADPERYDGKLVTVQGFLNLEFEGDAIYPSRSDFDAGLIRNSAWVDGPKFGEPAARRALSGHYVFLTGRYNPHTNGHMGLHTGTFDDVSRISILPSRAQGRMEMLHLYRDLPWPLLIAVLLAASLVAMAALMSARGPGRWRVRGALLVAGAVAVFSVCRLWELPLMIHALLRSGYPPEAWRLSFELAIGVSALVASAICAARRNYRLCVLFAATQLVVPAIVEVRAFMIFDVPSSIHSARLHDYDWSRADHPVSVQPSGDPHRIDPPAS